MVMLKQCIAILSAIFIAAGGNKLNENTVSENLSPDNIKSVAEAFQNTLLVYGRSNMPYSEYADCRANMKPEYVLNVDETGYFIRKDYGYCDIELHGYIPPANVKEMTDWTTNVVIGEVLDITYSDSVSTGGYNNSAITTYSFAVQDVLKGDEIEPETIITVMEIQGYIRRSVKKYSDDAKIEYPLSDDKVYYVERYATQPLVEKGEQMVLFLEPYECDYMDGRLYTNVLLYSGKYIRNKSGLYETYIYECPDKDCEWKEFYTELYYEPDADGGYRLKEAPMTLYEIIKKIMDEVRVNDTVTPFGNHTYA